MQQPPITLIGAGLVGALLAHRLVRRAWRSTFEKREDPRRGKVGAVQRGKAQDAVLDELLRDATSIRDVDVRAAADTLRARLPPLPVPRHG